MLRPLSFTILSYVIYSWHLSIENPVGTRRNCSVFRPMMDISSQIVPKKLSESSYLDSFLQGLMEIWKNQHPKSCMNSKFLISSGEHLAGFGSEIHVEGAALGLAMSLGRILIDVPYTMKSMSWKFQNKFCKSRNKANKECYFETWSNCSIQDVIGSNNPLLIHQILHGKQTHSNIQILRLNRSEIRLLVEGSITPTRLVQLGHLKALIPSHTNEYKHGFLPPFLHDIVSCTRLKRKYWFYWWRAVSAAYLTRPNQFTVNWLLSHHTLPIQSSFGSNIITGNTIENNSYSKCIAVYVRRGDKGKEMKLIPFSQYAAAAEMLWGRLQDIFYPTMSTTQPTMFFSSEDPLVLEEAILWARNANWKLLYTNVIDRNKSPARLAETGRRFSYAGLEEEYLAMILNLEYSVGCHAWVCTLASNFCRLIDELRAVRGKYHLPFADLSVETCGSPPCIGTGIKSLDW